MTLRFSQLDRPAIRRLQPGEKIAEHGITAARLADGDLRYTVAIMVDGRRIHRVIGKESDRVTRTQCEEFVEQARSDARRGALNLPKGRKLAFTFAAAGADYVKRLEQANGRNVAIKRRQLRMYLAPFFGTMRLTRLRRSLSRNTKSAGSIRARLPLPSTASWPPCRTCSRKRSNGDSSTASRPGRRSSPRAPAGSSP